VAIPDVRRDRNGWAALRATLRLGPADLVALVEVVGVLVCVELALRSQPLTRVVRPLGVTLRLSADPSSEPRADPVSPGLSRDRFRPAEVRKVRLARRVVGRWPFGTGPCLRESLVVGHILRRHHPELRLGVAREGQAIAAHAWLEVAGVSLESDRGFLPLGV